jgi:hypothetical protein
MCPSTKYVYIYIYILVMERLYVNKTMSECHHLLPNEDVVDHCTATENDTHTNKHASHNGWSGVKLDESV